ncbi:hypothetical protein LINPERHAP1_LOCUS7477 [Linum perenne]
MERDLEALRLLDDDDDDIALSVIDGNSKSLSFDLCLVGSLLTNRPFNFNVFKNRMASIWQPARGVQIQDLGEKLILFSFFHQKDLRWVVEGRALDVRYASTTPLRTQTRRTTFASGPASCGFLGPGL